MPGLEDEEATPQRRPSCFHPHVVGERAAVEIRADGLTIRITVRTRQAFDLGPPGGVEQLPGDATDDAMTIAAPRSRLAWDEAERAYNQRQDETAG